MKTKRLLLSLIVLCMLGGDIYAHGLHSRRDSVLLAGVNGTDLQSSVQAETNEPGLLGGVKYYIKMVWQRIKAKLNDPGDAPITPSVFDPGLRRHPKILPDIDRNVPGPINQYQP